MLLTVRRLAIFAILLLRLYVLPVGGRGTARFDRPAFVRSYRAAGARFLWRTPWRRATSAGAIAGMSAGFLVWAYTLLLPTLSDIGVVGERILTAGPWGLSMLRPQHLLGLELPPLVHGVTWSLLLNMLFYIGFSLRREPSPIERLQANTLCLRISHRSLQVSACGALR